jgi:carbon-monoxide dehydrogenase large subunit
VSIDVVVVHQGDTAVAPFGGGTGGSRTAIVVGGAVREAAAEARAKVAAIAAHLLEASPDDIVLEGGRAFVAGAPARAVGLADVAAVAYLAPERLPEGTPPGLEFTARHRGPAVTYSNACHACVCEVDVRTGAVRLLRYVVSEDCGVMINPAIVEGQIAGGVAQGIGGALMEEVVYDASGNPLTTTFLDYLIPTAADVPPITFGHIETPSPALGGHKGMGEGGAIGSPAAVFNAVADALAPLGVRLHRTPLSPAAVLAALTDAGAAVP